MRTIAVLFVLLFTACQNPEIQTGERYQSRSSLEIVTVVATGTGQELWNRNPEYKVDMSEFDTVIAGQHRVAFRFHSRFPFDSLYLPHSCVMFRGDSTLKVVLADSFRVSYPYPVKG